MKYLLFGIGATLGSLIILEGFNIISGAICGKLNP